MLSSTRVYHLNGLGAYGAGIRDEVPPWCSIRADFQECSKKQLEACTDDCGTNTLNPPADCVSKCTAGWIQIQCTPKCLAAQPTDPAGAAAPSSPLQMKVLGIPVVAIGFIGVTTVVAAFVLSRKG